MPIERNGQNIGDITLNGNAIGEVTVNGTTVFTSGVEVVAKTNLIAWWRMGDDGDDALKDSANTSDFGDATSYDFVEQGQSDNTTNTLPSGGVTDIREGANSSAYDMISDGNLEAPLTNFTTPFTIMGWVNFDDLSDGNRGIMGDWNSGDSDFYIQYKAGNNEGFKLVDDLADNTANLAATNTGQWVHVTGVYNSTNRLYVDAIQQSAVPGTSSGNYTTGDGFDVGSLNNSIQFVDGQFDDVRVYDRELTASEISTIFDRTKP